MSSDEFDHFLIYYFLFLVSEIRPRNNSTSTLTDKNLGQWIVPGFKLRYPQQLLNGCHRPKSSNLS